MNTLPLVPITKDYYTCLWFTNLSQHFIESWNQFLNTGYFLESFSNRDSVYIFIFLKLIEFKDVKVKKVIFPDRTKYYFSGVPRLTYRGTLFYHIFSRGSEQEQRTVRQFMFNSIKNYCLSNDDPVDYVMFEYTNAERQPKC